MPCQQKNINQLSTQQGGGFKYFSIVIPTWWHDPIWQAYFFSDGLIETSK